MHDWTFVTLVVEWPKGVVTITLKNSSSAEVFIIAEGLTDLKVPKRESWGESVSINVVNGPKILDNGNSYLSIEIQSGDVIEIEAKSISIPEN